MTLGRVCAVLGEAVWAKLVCRESVSDRSPPGGRRRAIRLVLEAAGAIRATVNKFGIFFKSQKYS